MQRDVLLDYLNRYLNCAAFKDFTANGLQVEGRDEVGRVVTAVTASASAIAYAKDIGADVLLVHHGYFWKGEDSRITGLKKQRLAALLSDDINLLAYHLPLDQHSELGNNRLFAQHFATHSIWQSSAEALIWHGEIAPTTLEQIERNLRESLPTETLFLIKPPALQNQMISRIAWCTGAAQDFLIQAQREGAQLFISGEYAERTYHEAHETGCAFIACGHHASERAGVRKLGEHLAAQFDLEVCFFDEPNPF